MFAITLVGKTGKCIHHFCDGTQLVKKSELISLIIYLIFFIIFLIAIFTLKSDLSYLIFSASLSFIIFLFDFCLFVSFKCTIGKEKVSADTHDNNGLTTDQENSQDENHQNENNQNENNQNENNQNDNNQNENNQNENDQNEDNQNENNQNTNTDENVIPLNINPALYALRNRLFNGSNISFDVIYELIDLGYSPDEIIELINYCQDHPECLVNSGDDNDDNNNNLENNPSSKDIINYLFTNNFHFIHIVINFFLSFLASFSLIYVICHYHSSKLNKALSAFILGVAHKTLISPIKNELYSTNLDEYENTQTRCFSISVLSIGLFFIHKYEIDYFDVDYYLFIFLIFMFLDITVFEGFIGLPRTTIHWFFEFVNRYLFGFSGCSTILYGIFQLLLGYIVTAGCSLLLYFYKNVYWTRTIFFFLSSFICKIELNKNVCISAIIHSVIASVFFILFNRFFSNDTKYYNIISIVQIGYYAVFEFILPYLSSISPYLFFYVQLFESNRALKYIRMSITSISAPILLGSLLSDDCNYILTSLLIVHSNNRYLSEPYVFGLGILIARFALYYDFEMKSNLALNLLIGLIISRKFFSILPLLHYRQKISIDCTDIFSLLGGGKTIIKIFFIYFRAFLFPLTNCLHIPAFLWSFITGAPINLFYLHYLLPQPSPPRCNVFWDHPKEKINPKEHPVESFVYYSYLQSFKKSLYDLIKKGKFGVIDENSFLLFLEENYTIILHIVSMNSFSVDFQIRCSEFVRKTLCHAGELGFLNSSSQNDYMRNLNLEDTPTFFQSVFTPLAQNVELNGYHHYPIDIKASFLSLTREHKRGWMTYAICFFFSRNAKEFELTDYFDNPISEINVSENENGKEDENEKKNDNHSNSNRNADDNNENNDNNNNENNDNNNENNSNDDSDTDSNDHTNNENSNQSSETINYDYKKSYKTLDDEAFEQFEFGDFSQRIKNFINVIYKEVNRQINYPVCFFQKSAKFKFTSHFPLFHSQLNNNNNNKSNDNNNNNNNENSENNSDVEIDNRSDSDENKANDTKLNKNTNEAKNCNLNSKKVEWLVKESAKRVYLYWCLAGSYLSPDLEEKGEIRDFLEETEEEYVIIENDSDKWGDYVNLLRDQNLPKKKIAKKKKKEKEKNETGNELSDLNELEPTDNNIQQIPRNYFTLFREIEEMNFTFIRQTVMEKWMVFRLHREYVRSIWTSQCQEVIGFSNYDSERSSMQENNNHLHNLIIQVSDLPVEYPAYVSKVEKSYIVL